MLPVFVLVFLMVSGPSFAFQDKDGEVIGEMRKTINDLQMTIYEMNGRMNAMETKMELLELENSILKQKPGDEMNHGKKVHQNSTDGPSRRLVLSENEPVAFLATLAKLGIEEHLGVNQNIMFDTVITNLGGAFNVNHGIFIVPESGVYLFSATVMSWIDSEVHASIMVNGQRTVNLFGHGSVGRHEQGTQVAVLQLKRGDTVSVENVNLADISIWGDRFTSFTGVLLYPTA